MRECHTTTITALRSSTEPWKRVFVSRVSRAPDGSTVNIHVMHYCRVYTYSLKKDLKCTKPHLGYYDAAVMTDKKSSICI